MTNPYPFNWKKVSDEEKSHRAKFWTAKNSKAVEPMISTPMKIYMPLAFDNGNTPLMIWNMEPRPEDIWLISYPKSGTTMTQELLWQMSRGCNIDSVEARTKLMLRSPFLDCGKNSIRYANKLQDPRILKTHLPLSMIPPSALDVCKVVVVARNVNDVCVSYYHHDKLFERLGWSETALFEDYVEFFMKGEVLHGDYWTHLKVYSLAIYFSLKCVYISFIF